MSFNAIHETKNLAKIFRIYSKYVSMSSEIYLNQDNVFLFQTNTGDLNSYVCFSSGRADLFKFHQ